MIYIPVAILQWSWKKNIVLCFSFQSIYKRINWGFRGFLFPPKPLSSAGIIPSRANTDCVIVDSAITEYCELKKMYGPLDSESERIFSEDDDSINLNTVSKQQAHTERVSSPSPNAMKRRRSLPAIFDSSEEEENDEVHSRSQVQ